MERSAEHGQSLLEVIIATAIGALLIATAAGLLVPALRTNTQSGQIQIGAALAKQLGDNVTVFAESSWHNVDGLATTSVHKYYLNATSSPFTVATGTESVVVATTTFTRDFYVDYVNRDGSGDITGGAGTNDPSTRKITIEYKWPNVNTTTVIFYVTRFHSNAYNATDWSNGAGNNLAYTTTISGYSTSSNITTTSTPGSIQLAAGTTSSTPSTTVAFDALGPGANGSFALNTSSLTWAHTVSTTGLNRLLTVGVVVGKSPPDTGLSLGATYNGVTMASSTLKHQASSTAGFTELFYLTNPATGTHNVVVTLSGGVADMEAGSLSFTGVNSTTPLRNIVTNLAASGTSTSVSVTSNVNDMVLDVFGVGSGVSSSFQTKEWLKNQNTNTAGGNGAESIAAGAASVTMGYIFVNDGYALIGADVAAAP